MRSGVYETDERPSACLSRRSTAACGGFAAERLASRRYRPIAGAGAQQQMRAVPCLQPMSMSMSMWSLRWHFTNKSVTGAPYSIKSYSLSDIMVKSTMTETVPSWGRGGSAATMAQNEQTTEEHSTLEQQSPGRLDHPAWCVVWTVSQPRNAAEHRFVNIVSFWNDLFEINGNSYWDGVNWCFFRAP